MSKSPDISDEELAAEARALRGLLRGLVRDEHLVEDLVQDTLVVAVTDGGGRRGGLGAWLRGVARNLTRMAVRSSARRRRHEALAVVASRVPDPPEAAARLDAVEQVVRAVRSLPEPYRSTLVARYLDERSVAEIAAAQGVGESTVRTRVSRGLGLVRERLDRENGGRSAWLLPLLPSLSLTPRAAAASGLGSGASLLRKGVVVMSLKNAAIPVAVLLVAAALGTAWWSLGPSRSDDAPATPEVSPEPPPAAARSDGGPEDGGSVAGVELPPPVDLAAADRDHDLFGRVVSERGDPVPGARIETIRRPWRRSSVLNSEGYFATEAGPGTLTARDGTFSIRLARGLLVDLRVTADGYGEMVVSRCQAGERVDVTLTPGAELLVVVKDEAGAPVADVRLRLWRNPGAARLSVVQREGTTDQDGRHLFSGLSAGPVFIEARHPVLGSPFWEQPEVPESGRTGVEITLLAGRTVTGRVTDSDTGSGIPGATVGAGWPLRRPVLTGPDGTYSFPGWTGEGIRDLHVVAEGYGRAAKLVLREGPVDFALRRGDEIAGRVVSADGAPVGGALLTALAHRPAGDGSSDLDTVSGRSGADGRFRLTSVRRDIPHTLVVQADGCGKVLLDFGAHPGGPGRVDLGDVRLPAPRAIEGRVLDSEGNPIAGADVTLQLLDARAVSRSYGGEEERRTDDLGRFRFPDLSPGHYWVGARAAGAPPLSTEVSLTAESDVLDVVLEETETREVTIRVVGPDGEPVAGAAVMSQTVGAPANARTGSDGKAVLRGLPASEIRIAVYLFGDLGGLYAPHRGLVLVPSGQEVVVRLRAGGRIAGTLLDPEGRPAPGLLVRAVPLAEGDEPVLTYADQEGRFSLTVPAGETFDLVVDGQEKGGGGFGATAAPLTGRRDGVTAPAEGLEVRLDRVAMDRTLTVTVLGVDGRPVGGATVSVSSPGRQVRSETGAGGQVEFEGLPAVKTSVWVFPPRSGGGFADTANPCAEKLVPDGRELRMYFRRAVSFTGIVLDPEGRPVAGAAISVITKDGHSRDVRSGEDGRFSIAGAPGVAHQFYVQKPLDGGGRLFAMLSDAFPGKGEVEIRLEKQ